VEIKSRCEIVHFPPYALHLFLPYAKKMLDSVSVEYDDDVLFDGLKQVFKTYADNRKYYQWLDRVIREN
jgi:hypothetical protein